MDRAYEAYCIADPLFYDSPARPDGDEAVFEPARQPAPSGWEQANLDDWLVRMPADAALPPQGWKIHASACLEDAEATLATVAGYCGSRRLPFKFIRSPRLLFLRNQKYAHRAASGKFITIYPADEAQLQAVLEELGNTLAGRRGPYILSDLRWGAGPLYVRYGGFSDRYCVGPDGEMLPAIADPDGLLVPDRREAVFHLPPWVSLPAFLEPHLAARNATTLEGLPYTVERALHFSNGGGVYAGLDTRTGERVVLKEARPHAGLDTDGVDAVSRLRGERDMLQRLAGAGVAPAARDYFALGEHEFLVQDFVEGVPLGAQIVERYPLIRAGSDAEAVAGYASWALEVYGRVERAVLAAHERGVLIGDLHPSNVLVRPDGTVALIDLEVASDVAEGRRPTLADPAFMAPRGCTGLDIDRYALACLRLHFFLPLTTLIRFDRDKARDFARDIAAAFPVPQPFLDEAVRTLTPVGSPNGRVRHAEPDRPRLEPDAAGWTRARDSMARAILASATPDRDDRLFPGDIKQFERGGLGIAFGAAGVLYALAATGAGRHPELEEWLVDRATRPEPDARIGLYDGLQGVAWVLDRLGRHGDALDVLQASSQILNATWDRLGLDLFGGLSGIGLNLAHFAEVTGDPQLRAAVWTVAEAVADRLGAEDDVEPVSGGTHPYAGLVRGSSGPALMFIRLYEQSGESALLDLAATALGQDLRRCVLREDGSLEVNEGWRSMPYLADGSVGIGMVLDEYLRHREDERFAVAAAQIRTAASLRFYIEPGLFWGRAGMILHLSRSARAWGSGIDPVAADHVRRLAWHALSHRGHMAFPGEQLLRLSMDLATGTAGVLLALGAALHEDPVHLPFLAPIGEPTAARTEAIASVERR